MQDDSAAGAGCDFNGQGAYLSCTGNLLAPHLVLTAAHCVEPALVRDDACPNAELVRVVVCFNYNPGNTSPDYM